MDASRCGDHGGPRLIHASSFRGPYFDFARIPSQTSVWWRAAMTTDHAQQAPKVQPNEPSHTPTRREDWTPHKIPLDRPTFEPAIQPIDPWPEPPIPDPPK